MQQTPYLIFNLKNTQYGINANVVQEIFSLPEITPIPETPPDIVGVINLRNQILPIMDLTLRFLEQESPNLGENFIPNYSLTDSILVIAHQKTKIGIIVNQVSEIQKISLTQITQDISYGRPKPPHRTHFILGIATIESNIINLLNPQTLIEYSDQQNWQDHEQLVHQSIWDESGQLRQFCPHISQAQRDLFKQRAQSLRAANHNLNHTKLITLVILELNQEYYGLNLQVIREFTDIKQLTPIPCTPSHIIGNINLRGEIVTLIDIRQVLNLSLKSEQKPTTAIIVNIDDIIIGIIVDQVLDVIDVNPAQIQPVPSAIQSNKNKNDFLQGTAPYKEKIIAILDLPKILYQGSLVIDEEVV